MGKKNSIAPTKKREPRPKAPRKSNTKSQLVELRPMFVPPVRLEPGQIAF